MDVAIVTWSGLPQLDSYDAPIVSALADLKVVAKPCIWDDPEVDWSRPKAAVVRSAWGAPSYNPASTGMEIENQNPENTQLPLASRVQR